MTNEYWTLDDLRVVASDSGNDNPGVFLLSDRKTKDQASEAFGPTNIFIDEYGDIIIQFNEEMIND